MDWSALPPLTALRALAAYADTGSMATAGAQLNVSHAAISQQIKGLEDRLALTLLDRQRGHGALTPEGRALADAALSGFAEIANICAEMTGRDADRPLHISTTPSFASAWLMPRLAAFHAKHPNVSLMVDPTPEVRSFGPGGLDMAIRYGSGNWAGLTAELLLETRIAIVGAPSLVGDRDFSSPADLTDYHWLQELGTNETSEYLNLHGAALNRSRGLTSLPGNLMLEAARAGQGIGITTRAWADADIEAGRLRLLFEGDKRKGYFLVYRPGVMRPTARAFYKWLVAECRDKAGS